MFVDDTYLIHSTDDPQAPLTDIEHVVQHDSSLWNTGLHITGGKLEGSKSKYLVLYWTFSTNGIPKLKTLDNNNNNPVHLHLFGQPQEQLKRIRHDLDENQFNSLGTYTSIGHSILQWTTPLPYLESKWLCHIREGLWQIFGTLYIPQLQIEPLQRENDAYIMEHLLQDLSLTPTTLHSLNSFRLYLKVLRLSDIVSTDGKPILPGFLNGAQQNDATPLTWPTQTSPNILTWKLWRQTLSRLFLIGNKLINPLKGWQWITNKYI